jgi:Ion channel
MDRAAMRDRRRERWVERAERVRDAFGLVFVLVIATYVLTSLLANDGWPAVILCLATSATSIVALTSSHVQHERVRAAAILAALSLLLAVIAAISGGHIWLNLASSLQVIVLAVAMGAVLLRVVTTAEVGSRTILGAISVYTVLGLLFTYVYATIDRLQGGAFFEGHASVHGGDFLFFSYTTLTTTGFGDLVPGGQPGRMISGLEMMIGQVFLVTLVAGLVALWRPGESLRKRREEREAGLTPPPSSE